MLCWEVCVFKGSVAEAVEGTGRQVVVVVVAPAGPRDGRRSRAGAPVTAILAREMVTLYSVTAALIRNYYTHDNNMSQSLPRDVTKLNL